MCSNLLDCFSFGFSSSSSRMTQKVRKVNVNNPDGEFVNNAVTTGKYNFFTFLPIFTFVQLRKTANAFFVVICILQQIPDVSPTGRFTTLLPLTFILFVAAIKEIIEDYKRHTDDGQVNNRKTRVFRNGKFQYLPWKDIQVGEVVQVRGGEFVPADVVLLSSSEPQAMCYIETAMLDGETNLKIKQGLKETSHLVDESQIASLRADVTIECDTPNQNLYDFHGNISSPQDPQQDRLSLGLGQVILRGCMLRNTAWINTVVVYTGHETKIMMNSKKNTMKRSRQEQTANTQICYLLVVLLVAALSSTIGHTIFNKTHPDPWYLPTETNAVSFMFSLLTFIIVYNNLVPISLMVTLEVVKYVQAIYINNDMDMYHEASGTPAQAKTSNLNEELGQIEYILTDKTGTLTQNIMVFRKASVAGFQYGENPTSTTFDDAGFVQKLRAGGDDAVVDFVRVMSVCHSVVPEHFDENTKLRTLVTKNSIDDMQQHNGDDLFKQLRYQSSSPDEEAIVAAAKNMGFVFYMRSPKHIHVRENGRDVEYEILNVLEFTSDRKRMSVIVRTSDNKIQLMCKGADEVIFPRLSPHSKYKDETRAHLMKYANEGLRTLCFAHAHIDAERYAAWNEEEFVPANNAVIDRERLLEQAYQLVEKDLYLVGASAIEDKLQEGVPDTIEVLLQANIKIWVLTGDKVETAINIANSCKLINSNMKTWIVDQDSLEETTRKMESISAEQATDDKSYEECCVVVSGKSLKHAFTDVDSLVRILSQCKSVLCCRVSPIQKAQIVELIRNKLQAVTLAIGDGGNDVSMIQSADVGVGISGMEGLQAANASDYSIAQFRFLKILLLVHGSWNYARSAKCILFSFYKNICLYLIQFWFAFYNGFTGQILFERWTIALYNVFFTSLQPFAIGIFDRTFDRTTMCKYPKLYKQTQQSVNFNAPVFWQMCLNATVHSAMLFFIPSIALGDTSPLGNGTTTGYLFLGNMVYTYVIITVSLKAGLETFSWTIFTHIAIWGSIVTWFVFMIVYAHFYQILPVGSNYLALTSNMFSSFYFWSGTLFFPFIVLYRDLVWKILRKLYMSSVVEEVRKSATRSPTLAAGLNEGSPRWTNERMNLIGQMSTYQNK